MKYTLQTYKNKNWRVVKDNYGETIRSTDLKEVKGHGNFLGHSLMLRNKFFRLRIIDNIKRHVWWEGKSSKYIV